MIYADSGASTALIGQDNVFVFTVGPRAEAGDLYAARLLERRQYAEAIEIACAARVDELTAELRVVATRVRFEDDDAGTTSREGEGGRQPGEASPAHDDICSLHASSAIRVCVRG